MKSLYSFLLVFLISWAAAGQSGYKISEARKVKSGYEPFPRDFTTKALPWGKIESECSTGDVTYGNWFELNTSRDQQKFTVKTGSRWGNIVRPTMHFFVVEEMSRENRLTELACVDFDQNQDEYSLECLGMEKGREYYVLVTSKEEKRAYAITTTHDFEPSAPVDHAMLRGRVRDSQGNPKSDVLVSLMSSDKKSLGSTSTDSKGEFVFEKLAPDEAFITMIAEEDPDLQVDILLYDGQGQPTLRAERIGNNIFKTVPLGSGFNDLIVLHESDWTINPGKGKKGIAGRVVDRETYLNGRSNVTVGLYSKARQLQSTTKTDVNGRFRFTGLDSDDFVVKIESDTEKDYSELVLVGDDNVPYFFSNSNHQNEDGFFAFEKLPEDVIEMKRLEVKDTELKLPAEPMLIEEGESIVLQQIRFESNSAELLPGSFMELGIVVEELKKKTHLKVEIEGHTDNTGDDEDNLVLSKKRADAVRAYLIGQGIDSVRLSAKGYGASQPVSSNDSEDGRRINRRVELKFKAN